jgi:hypothetical protein
MLSVLLAGAAYADTNESSLPLPKVRCTAINQQGTEFSAERILRRVAERAALRQCDRASDSPCQIKECVRI